ncbi:hypothetical protein LCGC14_1929450 [marine sediment metagenome]|uniref:Uncharacterized protein n=1 Tax=marine sediment metagenome TaxID=412755 RepID=A0A0F9IL67_9ZZZZ
MEQKLKDLCDKITKEQQQRLRERKLACQDNMDNAVARYHIKRKYSYVDIGKSGAYMIDNATSEIFSIKAYGVIHRGHRFGTLDTIDNYFWGDYRAYKLN